MPSYAPPRVTELGSLADLTQSLLPSTRSLAGTMAALSAPGGGGTITSPSQSPPATQTVTTTTTITEPSSSAPTTTGTTPGEGRGESGAGTTGPTTPGASLPGAGGAESSEGGNLPFTGFAVGISAAVGGALAGAGVAIRRVLRDR